MIATWFKKMLGVGLCLVILFYTTAFDFAGSPRAYALLNGAWSGTTSRAQPMSFTVTGTQWSTFVLTTDYSAPSCSATGTIQISTPGPGSITSDQFTYTNPSGTYSFEGQFTSPTSASGTYTFTNYQILASFFPSMCYYYLTQSGTWSATIPLPPPDSFSKLSPADASVDSSIPLTLDWGSSTYADSYQYCLDADVVPNSDCDTAWVDVGNTTSASPSGLTPSTTYYWQVQSSNASNTTDSDGGTWWSFTTLPVPGAFGKSGPADASSNQLIDASLSWTPSENATGYEYCIDTFPNDACDTSWQTGGITGTSVTPGLAWMVVYEWQVRATGGGTTDADGGTWWTFATGTEPPGDFSKSSPAYEAVNVSLSPTLSWDNSYGAASFEYCYYSTEPADCNEPWTLRTGGHSVPLSGLTANTTYHWQVRAFNNTSVTPANYGAWWTFTTLPNPPAAFTKSSPANAAVDASIPLTLSWNSSTYVDSYQYCVDADLVPNSTCDTSWVDVGTALSASPAGLTPSTTYYWQVQASNANSTTDADGGTWWSFTTLPAPGAFNKIAPANLSHRNPMSGITFSWTPSANATGYEVCIETFGENVIDTACDTSWRTGITETSVSYTLGEVGNEWNQIYLWQVRAVGGGSVEADGDGAFWSFDTAYLEPPYAFSKTAPLNAALNVSLSPTLSWSTSNNTGYYTYCYYSTDATDCNEPWTLTTTGTSVGLSGLTPGTTYHWGVRACNDIWCVNAGPDTWWTFTTIPPTVRLTLRSIASQDGWILEFGEFTNAGGSMNSTATTLRLGDDASKKQYRSILSFATGASLPDNAVITKVTLKVKKQGIAGTINPVTAFKGFMLDIRKGFFNSIALLQLPDWQSPASKTIGPFSPGLSSGWYVFDLTTGKGAINKLATGGGLTQIRLRFNLDDNNNGIANYLSLHSGNAVTNYRPQLIVDYYIP